MEKEIKKVRDEFEKKICVCKDMVRKKMYE